MAVTRRGTKISSLDPPLTAVCTAYPLWPGQALVTQLQDLLCRRGVSLTAAATQGDTGRARFMADRGPGNAHLGTDLAQAPTLGVQVG